MRKKFRQPKPDLQDPTEILSASGRRQLRPGELNTLADHINDLELQIQTLMDQIGRLQAGHREVISSRHIGIGLSATGAIELLFPDQHTVQIPVGLLQHDNAIAMNALMTVLKDRFREGAKFIGTQGAPTQSDLRAILAASKKNPRRVGDEDRKPKAAPFNISLDDLDL